jgi:hypothetical protein
MFLVCFLNARFTGLHANEPGEGNENGKEHDNPTVRKTTVYELENK